ncbi:MAG: hypothetical protein L0Y64_02100, partial [Myxococcaceae bacterium]|nr:hypothetical protein [Myxococcaceae bacterium]
FASGMAIAGAYGMGRKVYGAEQVRRSLPESLGMGIQGLGGAVAILGGVLFLWLVVSAWLAARRGAKVEQSRRETAWSMREGSTSAER